MDQQSYSGRYFRTCSSDIKSSQGWFGKICLLGLISFIPIFGQMTVYGYAYEWGHKAAWGVTEPLPKNIYGRPGSKMLRWGWFALVISFVFALIPGLVEGIGSWMSAAGSPVTVMTSYGVVSSGGNAALSGLGSLVTFIGAIGILVASIFSPVGVMRMTMYDRLGTGLQFGKVWEMAKRDFGGLMRIFGMTLLIGLIAGLIIGIIASVVVLVVLGTTLFPVFLGASSYTMSYSAMMGYVISAVLVLIPVILILMYVAFVVSAWLQLLVARAYGYWMQQFDVANWGTKDDPLPETTAASASAQPQSPAAPQPEASAASSAPTAPEGSVMEETIEVLETEPALPADDEQPVEGEQQE